MTNAFLDSFLTLFVLLNPFLMSIYLLDLLRSLEGRIFRRVLIRGTLISFVVFSIFAATGDAIFSKVLQVRFAAFLLFGGLVFLLVGIRFVMQGDEAIRSLRGDPEHLAGSIAMPFMIGPGTVSASVFAGTQLDVLPAIGAIGCALTATVVSLLLIKMLHDSVKEVNAQLVERYVDLTGRVSALIIGTIAIDMILKGIELWLGSMQISI